MPGQFGDSPPFPSLPGGIIALFVALVLAMALSIVFTARSSRRRKESIAAVVAANGLRYVASDQSLVNAFVGDPFGKGSSRRARDVVSGTHAGGSFQTFAYSYETRTTDANGHTTTQTHRFQVTWIPLAAPFPHVRITPDRAWIRALGSLAGHDVNTESAAFNAQWRVRANDERTAHAILTPPMIERLMLGDVAERAIVFQGPRLMSFVPQVSDLTELNVVVRMLQAVAALVPPFLLEDLRAPDGAQT